MFVNVSHKFSQHDLQRQFILVNPIRPYALTSHTTNSPMEWYVSSCTWLTKLVASTLLRYVLRTGERLDTHVLGSGNEEELVTSYMHAWVRYFGHPRMLHVNSDGVFDSEWFKAFLSHHHVLIRPCAGEAHWKVGLVERHIRAHKRLTGKLALDDIIYPNHGSVQQLIDHATMANSPWHERWHSTSCLGDRYS